MSTGELASAGKLESGDLDLVAALQVAPRAPLAAIASTLGVSSSTVSRRMARLEADGVLRVIGQLDWSVTGHGNPWHVWVNAGAGSARKVAATIAELPESQLVATTAGRADVYCAVQAASQDAVQDLLGERIAAIPGVDSAHSELVLRGVALADSWRLPRLSDDQLAALRAHAEADDVRTEPPGELTEDALRVARLLREHGRITAAQLARELGSTQSTAYRLLHTLLDRGIVRPRVEIEPRLLGYGLEAVIALTVAPGSIRTVSESLARHTSARYVSIVAGNSSVIHQGVFRDEDGLAEFLTSDLGALPGVLSFDVSVLLDVRKRYWRDRTTVR
ncbi:MULTISPECIES: Lrp/AsnC family transcriptional regulator [Prauserella salsuginis group]|uniref:Lrp/AsnC family transcriptional regulator n=1 Tax=Prauserella salsuginis TaxID=387889 RepID=A0ABW6G7Z6_9PSEU|nr:MULTISPECIES: Lrp/AsnC family transcriptional regulator [Prauserella salsuginis group]MCR3721700.1 DNA-binding transcriptional regulator, Lrp family [Prauserella flava]MCR3734392.1 DNA-binding transcriptional regulator, Lrp family [Prauserella salsuginis]